MIDFVIPCHPKDFQSLKLTIQGIGNISCAGTIFVVAVEDPCIADVTYVPESLYKGWVNKTSIEKKFQELAPHNLHRTKWVYQQMLKLYSSQVISQLSDTYVIVDCDTIFLRDVCFDPEKFYYCRAGEYHVPYVTPIQKLLGVRDTIGFSTICHHMNFNKKYLNQMIADVESRFDNLPFFECVLQNIDYRESSCVSEWDLYANYMILNHPEVCEQRQLTWTNVPFVPEISQLNSFKTDFDFISCHAWMRGIE